MPEHTVTLVMSDREARFSCDEETMILDAGLAHGLELPYLCRQGWCLTCAGKRLEGRVDQSRSLRYYPEDAEDDFVLTCTAVPKEDVRILTHQKNAMQAHRTALGLPTPRG